jgi:Leucine-rich repeat (LRR) protein
MKLSIGKFEIAGHRPGNVSRGRQDAVQALTRAERIRDYLPIKWRQKPIIESMVRASLDEVIAAPSTEIAAQESENANALRDIDNWVAQAPPEHRDSYQRIADQIKGCQESGETQLSLCNEPISSLPHLPTTLTSLTIRDCVRLTNVPNVAVCTALTNLTIRGCHGLTAAPDVSACTALSRLDLRDCPLSSLPENILTLPQHCRIAMTIDHLSDRVRNRLAAIMNAPGYAGPRIGFTMGRPEIMWLRPLSDEITTWMFETRRGDNAHSPINWDALPEESTQPFSTFFGRLRETQDYRAALTRSSFQQRVCSLIDQIQDTNNDDLRALCFSQASEAVSSCGDRVALAFIDMETACATRRAECDVKAGAYDRNPAGLVSLGRGMQRLQTLQTISREKAATLLLVDEIEVHLGYLVSLSQEFALPVHMQSMLYSRYNGLNEADIDTARQCLSTDENHNGLVTYFSTWSPMDLFLKRHHAQAFDELADLVSAGITEEKKVLQNQLDGLNTATDDYEQRCGELIKQFKAIETTVSARFKGDLIRANVDFSLLE